MATVHPPVLGYLINLFIILSKYNIHKPNMSGKKLYFLELSGHVTQNLLNHMFARFTKYQLNNLMPILQQRKQ